MTTRLTLLVIIGIAVVLAIVVLRPRSQDADGETGMPVQHPDQIAAGEVLYQANCARCHGADLRGTDSGPSHLSIVYEPGHHGDAAFVLAARNGVQAHHWPFGDMPPVPGLADDELAAIVAYVRENQRIHGFEPYPP